MSGRQHDRKSDRRRIGRRPFPVPAPVPLSTVVVDPKVQTFLLHEARVTLGDERVLEVLVDDGKLEHIHLYLAFTVSERVADALLRLRRTLGVTTMRVWQGISSQSAFSNVSGSDAMTTIRSLLSHFCCPARLQPLPLTRPKREREKR